MPSRSLSVSRVRLRHLFRRRTFVGDLYDLTSFVIAAGRAYAVCANHLTAVFAGGKLRSVKLAEPMGLAVVGAGVGYPSLGCCHLLFPSL